MAVKRSPRSTEKPVVIVTGSSGFIGMATIKRLATEYTVVGFDTFLPPHPPAEAECVCVDLTSDTSTAAAFDRVRAGYGSKLASVIHLASYFDLSGKPNPKYDEVTVRGTERLLHSVKEFGPVQFVFASTMLVHVPGKKGQPFNEDWPLDANLPYRESKLNAEYLIHDKHASLSTVIVRPAGVYDDQCRNAFLAHQIARIYERSPTGSVYPGDLEAGQSFLHLDDLTDAFARSIEHRSDLPAETTLLLGEPQTLSYGDIQAMLGRLIHDEPWETRPIPKPLALAGAWFEDEVLDEHAFIRPWMVELSDDHYELDISRAEELLGWSPKRSLEKTLPKMVDSLKRDPVGWYKANKLDAAKVAAKASTTKAGMDMNEHDPREHKQVLRQHHADMRRMHFEMLWVHYLTIALGLWLVISPFAFDLFGASSFSTAVMRVTSERHLSDPALRSALTGWSDVASGLLIMVCGALSLAPKFSWAQWVSTAIGIWLLFAPLIFWTPSAAAYANDTLIGALVITFAILVPMMPGMSDEAMMDRSDTPPGWTYSPSTYLQRLPIIALGAIGFVIARILAAYQLGHIDAVWEPFFTGDATRNGTEFIITSNVSKAWPIADGGLGATTYMFEVLMGAMGGSSRWRTMPWMVLMFGIAVVPLGVVSIYFIIIQPIEIGTYCTLCLLAALAMLIMIPFALDELVAMGQFLVANKRRGRPFWPSLLRGDALPGSSKDSAPDFDSSIAEMTSSATRGNTLPWTLLASVAIGVWLMFSRATFGNQEPLANADHLVGALVVTVAVIAMAEVARPLRFINLIFGVFLIVAPWIVGEGPVAALSNAIAGALLLALSLPRGKRSTARYGSWDRFVI